MMQEQENLQILMEIPFERRIAEVYQGASSSLSEMPEWKEKFSVGLCGPSKH